MAQNNTLDRATLTQRQQAMKIIFYGFDDSDLSTIITNGGNNGWVDGVAYSTSTPAPGV